MHNRTIVCTQNLEHNNDKYQNLEAKRVHFLNIMLKTDREYCFFFR